MRVRRKLFALSLLLCLVLLLQGCGGGGGGGIKPPKITSTNPSNLNVSMAPNEQKEFSVTVDSSSGDTLEYEWTSDTGNFLSKEGKKATWKAPATEGSANVTVKVIGQKGQDSKTWSITVTSAQPPKILNPKPVTSQTQPGEVNVNEEIILSIDTTDPQGLPLESTWTCTRGTIQNPQLNTAKWVAPGITGQAQVTVKVTNSAGKSATHTWYFDVKGNVVYVTEDITGTVTWATGSIYVIDEKDIEVRGTLIIQPGVVVKFGDGRSLRTTGSGRIQAVGKEDSPIVFTSLRDDDWGGDTDKDQGAVQPDPGIWGAVILETNSNRFEYCHFYYGGGSGAWYSPGMLQLDHSSGTQVKNCTFAFAEGVALQAKDATNVTIQGNAFYLNEKPLAIGAETSLDDSNIFHNPLNLDEKNTYQGIFVQAMPVEKPVSWTETEAAFVLEGYQWHVNGKLTLGPGVTVKLSEKAFLAVNDRATLEAKGEPGKPIVFTSINDSSYGGDSNGPAPDDPRPGDWEFIVIHNGGRGIFEHCVFAYGGSEEHMSEGWAALHDTNNSDGTTVKNTLFKNNRRGLTMLSTKSQIENCTFEENVYPLVVDLNIDTDNSLTIQDNRYNAIYLVVERSPQFAKQSVRWQNTGVPYVLLYDNLYTEGKTIVLGEGTILRVDRGLQINLEIGSKIENFNKAIFTSYRDTANGGDVGFGGGPNKGDWEGIWDESVLDYIGGPNILYAANPK